MQRLTVVVALASALFGLASAPASAGSSLSMAYHAASPSAGELHDGDFVTAPRAFQNFCAAHTDQCVSHGHADRISLDNARLAELEAVNRQVNLEIRPAPPADDTYRLGVSAGSCNEYAVEKRRRLLAQGWSASALSLAVVQLADGRGHLVLTARTDRGDLVLDNLANRLVTADQTPYTWLKRQSTIHPALWVRIGESPTRLATAF